MVPSEENYVPDVPSIKGGVFSLAVEDLSKLVSEDEIPQAELNRRLDHYDIADGLDAIGTVPDDVAVNRSAHGQ